jgi:hypothetical protein
VKWAQAKEIGAPFFEFHKVANDIDDINTALNLRYGFLADQATKIDKKSRVVQDIYCQVPSAALA